MHYNYIKKLLTLIILIEIPCIINVANSTQINISNGRRPLVVNRQGQNNNRNKNRHNSEEDKENTSSNLKANNVLEANVNTKINKVNIPEKYSNVQKRDLFKLMCKIADGFLGKETQPVEEEQQDLYDDMNDKMETGNCINVPVIEQTTNEETNVTRKQFDVLSQIADAKMNGVLNDVKPEYQEMIEEGIDKTEDGNVMNVMGSITDNSSRKQHEQTTDRININAISLNQDVIPEDYADAVHMTTLTDTYKSSIVKNISEIPIYTRTGLSNMNITGVAKTYDITTEVQEKADKARESRQAITDNTEENNSSLLESKNKKQSNAIDNKQYNTKSEVINTDTNNNKEINNNTNNNQNTNTDINTNSNQAINDNKDINDDQNMNSNQAINTDINTDDNESSQPKKKLKPKTILRTVQQLQKIDEDDKEDEKEVRDNNENNISKQKEIEDNIVLNQTNEIINNNVIKEDKDNNIILNNNNADEDNKEDKQTGNNQLLNPNNEDEKIVKEENKPSNEEDKKIEKEENNNININENNNVSINQENNNINKEKDINIKQHVEINVTESKVSENKIKENNNININSNNTKVKNNLHNDDDSSSENSWSNSSFEDNNDAETSNNKVHEADAAQNNDVHNLTIADISVTPNNDNDDDKQINKNPEVVTKLLTNNNNDITLVSDNNMVNNGNITSDNSRNNNDINTNSNQMNNNNAIILRNNNQAENSNDATNLRYTENALYGDNNRNNNTDSNNNAVLRDNNAILKAEEPTNQLFNNIGIGTTKEGNANKFTVANEKVEMDNIRLGANDKLKIESTNKEINLKTLAIGHDAEFEYYGEQENPTIGVVKTPTTGKFHIDIAKEGVEKKGGKADWITLDTVMPDTDGEIQPLLRNTNGLLRTKNTALRANGNSNNTLLGDPSGQPYNGQIKANFYFEENAKEGFVLRYNVLAINNFVGYSNCTFTIIMNKDTLFESSVNGWQNKLTEAYYKASIVNEDAYAQVKDISTTLLSYDNTSTKYDNTLIKNSNGDEYQFIACEGALYLVRVTNENKDAIQNALTNNGGVVDKTTLDTILKGAENTDSSNNNNDNKDPNTNEDPKETDDTDSTDDSDTEIDDYYNQYQGADFSKLAKYDGLDGSSKSIRNTIKNNPASALATYCADLESKEKSSKGLLNQLFDDDLLDVLSPDQASKKKYWIKGSIFGMNNNNWNNNSVLLGGDILNKSVLGSNLKLSLMGGTMFGNVKNYSNEYKTREFFVGPKVSFLNKYFTCELLGLYRHNNVAYSKDNKNAFVNNGLSVGGKVGVNISLADMFVIQPYIKALYSQLKPSKPITDLSTTYQFDLAPGLAFGFKLPYDISLTLCYQHSIDPTLKDNKGIDLMNNKKKGSNTFGIGINKSVNSLAIGATVSVDVNNNENKNNNNNKNTVDIEAQLQVSKLL